VELHGGSITASSDGRGRGARFTVTLPATIQAPPIAAPDLAVNVEST
jgi:signal transduction histidine kinase